MGWIMENCGIWNWKKALRTGRNLKKRIESGDGMEQGKLQDGRCDMDLAESLQSKVTKIHFGANFPNIKFRDKCVDGYSTDFEFFS